MFGSKNTTTGTTTTANNGGILSRLRNRNTTKKPVYTTSSRNTNTLGTNNTSTTGVKKSRFGKKSAGTGPALMSHHKKAPTLSQKVHGATKVMSGKMHNDHREVVAGEREMHGQSQGLGGFGGSKTGNARV